MEFTPGNITFIFLKLDVNRRPHGLGK